MLKINTMNALSTTGSLVQISWVVSEENTFAFCEVSARWRSFDTQQPRANNQQIQTVYHAQPCSAFNSL